MTDQDKKYMKEALKQAKKAYALDETPIGCVIVYEGKIISRGYNRRNVDKNTLAHAELAAIKKASRKLGDWRLEGCTMYVTLEPCPMCAGAIVQARITRVVIGCMNPKAGCAGSVLNLLQMDGFNHKVEIRNGDSGRRMQSVNEWIFPGTPKEEKRTGRFKEEFCSEYNKIGLFFSCAVLRTWPTSVTLAANSAQAPSRHPEGST